MVSRPGTLVGVIAKQAQRKNFESTILDRIFYLRAQKTMQLTGYSLAQLG